MHITDAAIAKALKDAKAANKRLEIADSITPGLKMRVSPSGKKVWLWAGKDTTGAVRRHSLGEYPALGIASAREKAMATRQAGRFEGADPTNDRRKARKVGADARAGIGTLGSLIDTYAKRTDDDAAKSWADGAKRVRRVFADLLNRHLSTLTVDDLIGAMRQTNVAGSALKRDANFAARTLRPWLRGNPESAHLGALKTEPAKVRERVISDQELARIIPILKDSKKQHNNAMRMLFWVPGRLNEVVGMTWGEINLDTGEWQSARKTKKGHKIDMILPKQAIAFLTARKPKKASPSELVFPSETGTRLSNWDRVNKRIHKESRTSGWHRHDVRRTGASILGLNGVIPDIVEAALGHKQIHSALAQTYNKSRYKPEVAKALQMLADHYDKLPKPD